MNLKNKHSKKNSCNWLRNKWVRFACHFANIRVEVLFLLDIVQEDTQR